jgi:hypothetical protein
MAISKVNAKIIEEAEKCKMFCNVLKNSDSPVQNLFINPDLGVTKNAFQLPKNNSNDNEPAEK